MLYDYLIVGAGLFGSVCAYELSRRGKSVLVADRRNHIGGNCYTHAMSGINVHEYGAHIFHTSDKRVWDYVNRFAKFNSYVNSPVANYKGEIYNLPFNMNTFSQMWGVTTADEAKAIIAEQVQKAGIKEPCNLEQQAISLVGTDIYEKLVKGYTEKQWGRQCKDLPAFIIKRLPLRFTYDNNYFNDTYQGIPTGGYTQIFDKLLEGIEVLTNVDYIRERKALSKSCRKIIYTGAIDEYYNYRYGELEYRGLRFVHEVRNEKSFQNSAVVNYTDKDTPYTRIIEHKHFEFGEQHNTVISYEYSAEWQRGHEAYYPVNDEKNTKLYQRYAALAKSDKKVIFGGRLGLYQYLDMDKTLSAVLNLIENIT